MRANLVTNYSPCAFQWGVDGIAIVTNGVGPGAEALIDAAKRGDESAWVELHSRYFPRLYRFFLTRTGSTQDAEDLTAETFVDAFRGLGGFRWRQRPFGAWLFAIARNRLRQHFRSRRLTTELMGDVAHIRNEYVAIEILDVLARLEPDQRTVIEYRYLLGLSGEETAAAMGRSHPAVRKLLGRANEAFRREYTSEKGSS